MFKVKYYLDGLLDKFKARLVARGFSQVQGVDFNQTFVPTVKFDSLRLFLAIVAVRNIECYQVDINNAFTESILKEKIFIAAPEGVDCPKGKVLRVLRSLYSLKQAARDWHEKLIKALLGIEFRQYTADPCFLIYDKRGILLLVYVDDICVAANLITQVNWFKSSFKKLFKVKDLGEIEKILGVKIIRNRSKRTIRMDQTSYLKMVFERIDMEYKKYKPTELPINSYSSLRPAGPNNERIDPE